MQTVVPRTRMRDQACIERQGSEGTRLFQGACEPREWARTRGG